MQGWCIIGTGLVDGYASLSPVKRTVPADSTREKQEYCRLASQLIQRNKRKAEKRDKNLHQKNRPFFSGAQKCLKKFGISFELH